MKTLEEKKLLVKMAKMFGQPVDQKLVESIEREEKLAAAIFGEFKKEASPPIPILKEDLLVEAEPISEPAKPAETNLQPPEEYKVQQVANYLDTVSNTKKPPLAAALQDNEFQALRKTVQDLLQKVNTLSWGGGGTGIVRIFDADDFDRTSAQNGRYMRWDNGIFSLDEIDTGEIINNTTLVTTNAYTVVANDYYIGVNYAGPVTITIPGGISSGREVVIKDESGNCETHNITVSARVDNDANGFINAIVTTSNPFPVTAVGDGLEVKGISPDAFGRTRVSELFTLGDYKHLFAIDPNFLDQTSNGTVTYVTNKACATLATNSNSSAYAIHQTKFYHHYQPGKSQLIFSSFVFGAPQRNVTKRTGYFDDRDGIYFEQVGSDTANGNLVANTTQTLNWVIRSYTGNTANESNIVINLHRFPMAWCWSRSLRIRA